MNNYDDFGVNVFSTEKMKALVSRETMDAFNMALLKGSKLNDYQLKEIANGLMKWATSRGATHYSHWFQPQSGVTAGKQDNFLAFDKDSKAITKLSEGLLAQSETDGSSFPSGGLRVTHSARGYAVWNIRTPAFIMEDRGDKTLYIPSILVGYNGEALDEKTAFLRSAEVLSNRAKDLLEVAGFNGVEGVIPTLGIEQEFFIIKKSFVGARPDLLMTGRTLLGAKTIKGQQLEDHYFGSIPSEVKELMNEIESTLLKLGVPCKTRHNEVAPNQFEMSPIFEEAGIASDHNLLIMEVIKKISSDYGYFAFFHEKPFAGVNGSGKHCNWSLAIKSESNKAIDGRNLLDPSKDKDPLMFLFVASVLSGIHKHNGLLRAAIASHGNDHRLGANEAPPAIISAYLGEYVDLMLENIISNEKGTLRPKSELELGIKTGLTILKDVSDRNRTSPFAFTQNKFEFRAVGSSANTAFPITVLNTVVAEGILEITNLIKAKIKIGIDTEDAILSAIKETLIKSKNIRFEGNGYSKEWQDEAKKRGIKNLKDSPAALVELVNPKSIELFEKMNVLTKKEITAKFHVKAEQYCKCVLIESETMLDMIRTSVIPSAIEYMNILGSIKDNSKCRYNLIIKIKDLLDNLYSSSEDLDLLINSAPSPEEESCMKHIRKILGVMKKIREVSDLLEGQIPGSLWTLPKYRDMLLRQ